MADSPKVRSPVAAVDVEAQAIKRCSVLSQVDNLVTISGVDLSYTVPVSGPTTTPKKKPELQILSDVTATFKSGRMTAVMGASGAGKTSLLYAMAGELPPSRMSGKLLVNGEPCQPTRIKQISGFVFQDDVLLDTMTVQEALIMSATLRLKHVSRQEERNGMVRELLQILGLEHCKSTVIGSSQVKGISGGERKRCAIAMELITNPAVLFLDEPTSGLDTLTAYNVVATLRDLAHIHGRTIICTIHQPSSDIYHLFDDLLLLGSGRVLYNGAVEGAIDYFNKRGFPCPHYTNPADYFFMHVVGQPGLADQWAGSQECKLIRSEIDSTLPGGIPKNIVKQHASMWVQFRYLLKRQIRNAYRNHMILNVKLFQNILVGLLVGLIYYDTDSKSVPTQIQDRNGALYFVVVSQFMGASMGFVSVFSTEKAVFMREYGAGYYSIIPYFFSKILVEVLTLNVVCHIIQSNKIYCRCRFK